MTQENFNTLPTGTIVSGRLTESGNKTLFIKIDNGRSLTTQHWHFLSGNTFALFPGNDIFNNPHFAQSIKIEIELMTIIQWRSNQLLNE